MSSDEVLLKFFSLFFWIIKPVLSIWCAMLFYVLRFCLLLIIYLFFLSLASLLDPPYVNIGISYCVFQKVKTVFLLP